jgi:hypothetical protein
MRIPNVKLGNQATAVVSIINSSLIFDSNENFKKGSQERIDCLMETQAFLRSYGSAPRPPPLPPANCLSLSLPVCRRSSLLTEGGGGGGGRGAESYHRKKAWASINGPILSASIK